MTEHAQLLPADGPAAPPRANGELVFSAPWQSRVFGLTVALHEAGRFEWGEFQQRLIRAIGHHETEAVEYDYWACWLEAFRDLAEHEAWFTATQLDSLETELRARPAGHDHG